MKKFFKIAGIFVGLLVALVLIGAIFISFRGIPSYEANPPDLKVEITEAKLERGQKLVLTLCAGCHMNDETRKLTGKQMLDAPPEFGTINSANITQDKTYGIGEWTDGELLLLLRTGIKRDGNYAPPYMAKLPKMADEDIESIIAFLHSDHPAVAADPTPDKPTEPSFLTKLLTNVAFKPLPMPEKSIPMPDTSNSVELGMYLAYNLECFSCHSADFKSNNYLEPEKSAGFFGGGNQPLNLSGQVVPTANLTPDKETGIGNWTKAQFIKAVKSGIKEGEPALQYPMMPYVFLTEKEVGAIYDYLMTIPPISNNVERKVYQ